MKCEKKHTWAEALGVSALVVLEASVDSELQDKESDPPTHGRTVTEG